MKMNGKWEGRTTWRETNFETTTEMGESRQKWIHGLLNFILRSPRTKSRMKSQEQVCYWHATWWRFSTGIAKILGEQVGRERLQLLIVNSVRIRREGNCWNSEAIRRLAHLKKIYGCFFLNKFYRAEEGYFSLSLQKPKTKTNSRMTRSRERHYSGWAKEKRDCRGIDK